MSHHIDEADLIEAAQQAVAAPPILGPEYHMYRARAEADARPLPALEHKDGKVQFVGMLRGKAVLR